MNTKQAHFQQLLREHVSASIEQVTQTFFQVMPQSYFETHEQDSILQHLSALLMAHTTDHQEHISLTNQQSSQQTRIHLGSYRGLLNNILMQLPAHQTLQQARVYTANDDSIAIDVFDFAQVADTPHIAQIRNACLAQLQTGASDTTSPMSAQRFIQNVNQYYLQRFSVAQLSEHAALVSQVYGQLSTAIAFESIDDTQGRYYLSYAAGQVEARFLLTRLARYLSYLQIDIREAFLENFEQNSPNQTALVTLHIHFQQNAAHADLVAQMAQYSAELRRLPYLPQGVIDIYCDHAQWTLKQAEVLMALCHIAHQILAADSNALLSKTAIIQIALAHPDLTLRICQALLQKFQSDNQMSVEAIQADIEQAIVQHIADSKEASVLLLLLRIVAGSLKSNVHFVNRYGLALRLSPDLFVSEQRPQRSFGIFYILGSGFDGFHVRFQDIARGGVRIVLPSNLEQYEIESRRLFDEVYQLSYAQQLKNKDIPEGGAKGVILVKPNRNPQSCGKAYIHSLLDLIVEPEYLNEARVDYYPDQELLFLGPDENISNDLIEWVIETAKQRQYTLPNALMSSKPNAGINHKAYGVTSEGVNIFLEVGLRHLGINPYEQPFTIKITGGPDGDVAGNLIKILHREFADNAIITGIADGSGCAEDPLGLDHQTLLHLVAHDLPIAQFDPAKLSAEGRVLSISDPEGVGARNSLHNRLQTDVFVPAGGRPATINERNWSQFMTDAGKPSSRLIVEGANLFLTASARELLTAQGVLIVKDSSANKCGVICSSYEIIAGMLLAESDFLAIKTDFVADVLMKLRHLAYLEARTLFQAYSMQPVTNLVELSMRLSQQIIAMTEQVATLIEQDSLATQGINQQLMLEFFPDSLRNRLGAQLIHQLPKRYFIRAMASILASRIIYHEGIDYLQGLDTAALQQYLQRYLAQEAKTYALMQQIATSDLPDKAAMIELLRKGGTGTALRWL